jgi:hypothetical protein
MVRAALFLKEAQEAFKIKNWSRANFFIGEIQFELSEAKKWIRENSNQIQTTSASGKS